MCILRATTALFLVLALAGCGDAMCDPNPVGEPWKPYESLLPSNAVVCGPNRKSSKKPSDAVDNYPATQVFVFFKGVNAPDAFDQTLKRFEAAGWKVADVQVNGKGADGLFDASFQKDGATIHVGVNKNDWGIQGSFSLTPPPSVKPSPAR